MNVIIPFEELGTDVQDALKNKSLQEGKTLSQVMREAVDRLFPKTFQTPKTTTDHRDDEGMIL